MTTKHIYVLLVALAVLFAADAFKWKNCDSSAPVQISQVSLSPHPLKLKPGQKIQFSAKFRVSGDAGQKYKVDLEVQRKAWRFWVPVPCVGKIGSCTHLGPNLTCHKMKTLISENTCPLPHKEHEIPLREVTFPDIPVPSVVTSGQYWIRGDLRDLSDNRRIACVEAYVDIA